MSPTEVTPAVSWPRDALARGTDIHGYRIEEVIGRGGFGITYRAVDGIDQVFAIKECFPRQFCVRQGNDVYASDQAAAEPFSQCLERFGLEARSLRQLASIDGAGEGIVKVATFFQANRTAYVVMEFLAGDNLSTVIRDNPAGLGASQLAFILPRLLHAVGCVHAANLLHRDIKPANIILRPDGSPVLIDFGAARAVSHGATATFTQIFSEGYAPIEQFSGMHQGPYSDIYALGATLYRAIGGRGVDSFTRHQAIVRGKRDPLPPATEIGAGRYDNSLLIAIDAAMIVAPEQRPQSIAELVALMQAADSDRTVELPRRRLAGAPETAMLADAPGVGPASSAPIVFQQRSWLPLYLAIAALALGGGATLWLLQIAGPTQPPPRVETQAPPPSVVTNEPLHLIPPSKPVPEVPPALTPPYAVTETQPAAQEPTRFVPPSKPVPEVPPALTPPYAATDTQPAAQEPTHFVPPSKPVPEVPPALTPQDAVTGTQPAAQELTRFVPPSKPVPSPAGPETWSEADRRAARIVLVLAGLNNAPVSGLDLDSKDRHAIDLFRRAAADRPLPNIPGLDLSDLPSLAKRLSALLLRGDVSPTGIRAATITDGAARYTRGRASDPSVVHPGDAHEAAFWYGLAARVGYIEAFTALGLLLARGYENGADVAGSSLLWWLAALRGEQTAAYDLGAMYEHGVGVASSRDIAALYYRIAADEGSAPARAALGRMGL